MATIIPVPSDFDEKRALQSLSPFNYEGEEREKHVESLRKFGLLPATDDGFFGELADSTARSFISGMEGLGATVKELTGDSSMQDYFRGVLDTNQQWNAPQTQSIGGYLGGAVGEAFGSTASVLAASTVGSLAGPKVGIAAGIAVGFSQTFGKNVQRNREAGYSENKAYGMAFLESGVDAVIENAPWGVVGKGTKLAVNLGRLNKISAAGKRQLVNKIGQKIAAQVGQKEAQRFLLRWGKQAAMTGLGEAGEEALQYLNTYMNQTLGGDPDAEFSMDDFAEAMAKGFIGGFALGGVQSLPGAVHDTRMNQLAAAQDNGGVIAPGVAMSQEVIAPEEQMHSVSPEVVVDEQPLFDNLISTVGSELGINIDFMDNHPDGERLQESKNGFYDDKSKTLYLNRNTYSTNPAETLGHELKHYIDKNDPELSKTFDALLEAGKNDAGKQEVAEIISEFKLSEAEGNAEFSADMFGKLFARPDTWRKMATALDEKTPGMGEKFLQTLRDFYALVKNKLEALVGKNPEAEAYLDNVNELQNEAARMLAELRRRNGNSSQEENVVGARGNTNVESVPVSQINVDAERFQFKSNTNKFSGVDESNKLGGDWDARTAGNLYLWQDKNGKLYVVNGHHRLELAQRMNVDNINAIIDRETDGISAEQARRNGVLINIRDGQGEVRDYASFVRDENLSEEEAESQGVTARQKGRAGFLIGKSGDTLYEAYRNEVIPESKAAIIAEVAKGNKAIEYAGIKLANEQKLSGEALRQTLKLAARYTSGTKTEATQGELFDAFDDSVLKEWERIGKAAAKHISEIKEQIIAAKNAVKNPDAAKKLGVKTSKGAEKLLAQAQAELMRWENYATDSELMAQLRNEAGIAPIEAVSKLENTTPKETIDEGRFNQASDVPLLSKEEDANAFSLVDETAQEAAAAEQKAEEQQKTQEELIKEKASEASTDLFADDTQTEEAVDKKNLTTENEAIDLFELEKKRLLLYGGPSRQMFFAILPDGKYIRGDMAFTKKSNTFEHEGKLYNVREIEKIFRGPLHKRSEDLPKKPAEQKQSEELPPKPAPGQKDATFEDFLKRFKPQMNAILELPKNKISARGNVYENDLISEANLAAWKAYESYDPSEGASIDTWASDLINKALAEFNRKQKRDYVSSGGIVSLDQTNEQGEALGETVADEDGSAGWGFESKVEDANSKIEKWRSSLKPRELKILQLRESGLSPSEIGRATGIGMTTEQVKKRLAEFDKVMADLRDEAELKFSRKRGQSIQKRDATLTEVAKLNMRNEVSRVIETGIPEGKYVFKNPDDKQKTIDGAIKFLEEFSRKIVPLSDGRIAYFMPDERAFERGSAATAWAEYGIHAVTSSGKQIPGKEYNERLFNQNKLDNLDRIIPIIQQENVFGKLDNKNPAKDGVIFVGTSHDGKRLEVITRLDEYGNPQADLTEVTVVEKNPQKNIPPLAPLTEVVEAVARHQEAGYSPSTNDNIPQSGEKSSADLEFFRKRLHQQINPIVRDGKVRDEYAFLLENKEFTPQSLEEYQKKGMEWILRRGGIPQAAKDILADKAPGDTALAEVVRSIILNSEVAERVLTHQERVALSELEIDARSSWGKAGRNMQFDALFLRSSAGVQALLNKFHKDMPDADKLKLRNEILDELGIDIFDLPKNITDDKTKLDTVLRKYLTHKSNFRDKFYEYWINAILSGPTTHAANLAGNLSNAAYELGIKRFTEALVNTVTGRKGGATFGEFKAMLKAFDWNNAVKAGKRAFDLEVLDPSGKFLENNLVAIDGKTGRVIRTPGRLLKASDALAVALIQPMETAAYAYRMGVSNGLSGTELQEYIQTQLSHKDSKANDWGRQRAKELTFQEDPGESINRLMSLRESNGVMGTALRFFLPFIKTPANILRQGVRKSPLGALGLAFDTVDVFRGKRKIDDQYISRVAEQLISFAAFAALYGLSGDDDELPVITGSSAPYGSAEYGFKANKIPPYSIRIGDTWYSYQRIEPLATGLALMADAITGIRNARNGKEGTAIMRDLVSGFKQIVVEKSYLDALGEINDALQDPESMAKPAQNLLASAMPNIVKQARMAFIEEVGDNKSRSKGLEWWQDQFHIVTNRAGITVPIPKLDYFGREIKKDDWNNSWLSDLGRLLPVKRIEADSNMDSAERLIWNYNLRNPNEEYYPSIPRHTFTFKKQKMYLSGKDYHDFAADAGKLAHRQIINAINGGYLNVNNPSKKDIELIKKIFSRARKETRQKYTNKAKKY